MAGYEWRGNIEIVL